MSDEAEIYVLTDDDGNEIEFRELFSFDSEDYGKTYIVLQPVENPEEGVLAYSIASDDDEGELQPIETDEEFDMVEEVMNTILDNPDL